MRWPRWPAAPLADGRTTRPASQPPLPTFHGFYEDVDNASAGEPHGERLVVGVAEGDQLGLPVAGQDVHGLAHDGTLDAAARHRARYLTLVVDDHRRPGITWPRALQPHHTGDRDPMPRRRPSVDVVQHVL